MTILAIDPGSTESAFVLYENGCLVEHGKLHNEAMIRRVGGDLGGLTTRLIIEKIASYGMAVGETVFETVYWSGRFAEAFGAQRTERVTRNIIKNHLCHSSKAKDANIRQALIDRFGGPESIKKGGPLYKVSKDVWAALAVAVTWSDKQAVGVEVTEARG